jgi:hypothetical protein
MKVDACSIYLETNWSPSVWHTQARRWLLCNWSGHIDKVLSMFPKFCCPAGAPFSERSLGKSVYYYLFQSSRAATILYHL